MTYKTFFNGTTMVYRKVSKVKRGGSVNQAEKDVKELDKIVKADPVVDKKQLQAKVRRDLFNSL